MAEIVSAEPQTLPQMQKLHQTAAAVHSDMRLTSALASYSGCRDALLALRTERSSPSPRQKKPQKTPN